MNTLKALKKPFLLFSVLLALSACRDDPGPDFGSADGQQIFESWQFNEIIRKGCTDANNNLRRPCSNCHSLIMRTDNTFEVKDIDDALVMQGNFRLVDDTDIVFDPSIFTNEEISNVRYSLLKGALKFDYDDPSTDCAVTEAYVVAGNNVSGD